MTATTTAPPTTPRPFAHLSEHDVERIGAELDRIRQDVLDSRGAGDAAYIRRLIAIQRGLELGGRAVLLVAGRHRAGWLLGTSSLALAKILDNMEIGHNVLHGQWDWMRDPKIHSSTWQWDHPSPPEQWQKAHNETHHTYTNIRGLDNDLGYGILRVDDDQDWRPRHLVQPLWNFFNACLFEYGIALYDLGVGDRLRAGGGDAQELKGDVRRTLVQVRRQVLKDYVIHPLLSGRGWKATLAANVTANVVRNVWSHSVIMCGHFPEGVETFEQDALSDDESRADWYLRQMVGSANISGSPLLHVLAGNLSHQIEHHLFPDLPSNRYRRIAPRVREVFERHRLNYHSRPLVQQVGSAWHKVFRLSLPNDWLAETNRRNVRSQLRDLVRQGREANARWKAQRAGELSSA